MTVTARTLFLPTLAMMMLAALVSAGCGGDHAAVSGGVASISATDLATITRELSDDSFQGRGPAGPGEPPTLEYLQAAYRRLGLEPMGDLADDPASGRSYLQEVGMVGITADPSTASLEFHGPSRAAGKQQPRYGPDFVSWTTREADCMDITADLVFVGYGTVAAEENWDDYDGQEMSGKILLMLVNDPPLDELATVLQEQGRTISPDPEPEIRLLLPIRPLPLRQGGRAGPVHRCRRALRRQASRLLTAGTRRLSRTPLSPAE